jgi:hypothetical protein
MIEKIIGQYHRLLYMMEIIMYVQLSNQSSHDPKLLREYLTLLRSDMLMKIMLRSFENGIISKRVSIL